MENGKTSTTTTEATKSEGEKSTDVESENVTEEVSDATTTTIAPMNAEEVKVENSQTEPEVSANETQQPQPDKVEEKQEA